MRRQRGGWLLVLGVALGACAAAAAGDWPRFRGPNGTGAAPDTGIPVRWTEQDGILWKAAIPGLGHSSPVVGGGRVFLQSAAADGRARWLLCLDAGTGKLLWQQEAPGRRAHTHEKNTLASSTPALDAERVYAAFWDGQDVHLCAYGLDGTPAWARDLGPFRSQHGAGFSPVVAGDKVLLSNDQDGSAVFLALEARTGKTLWQAERRAFRACYSSPLVLDSGGGKQVLVVSTAGVTGYDLATGALVWNCNWPAARMPLRTVSSPVVAGDLVVATAGDGAGDRLAIGVLLGGQGDVTATHLAWEDRKTFPYVPSVLALREHLYSVNDAGLAACHVARTGEVVWQERLGGPFTASPVLVDGKVYAAGEDGSVYVFRAAPEFKLLAKNPVGEPVSATPAVADNRLYVRGREHLFCIGKPAAGGAAGARGLRR
jgi:outer membrane protein assembly factor BamB